jgi:3-oxoacyl-(acyl-carrier-protein) synthase
MMDVQNLIWNYKFDRVIVLSVEDGVSNAVLEFFGEAQASLSYSEEQNGTLPSAFDGSNYGFRVAQGAVMAVFESSQYMERSGHTPKAEMLGSYTASESCSNAIGQREDGQGFINAIKGTLEVANVSNNEITVVKTHGTGTRSNNTAERAALEKTLSGFVATSYKPTVGHTMGASGLLESCLLFDSMRAGVIPKIENRTEQDNVYLSEDVETRGGVVLSLAAGMGNVYAAALFDTRVA